LKPHDFVVIKSSLFFKSCSVGVSYYLYVFPEFSLIIIFIEIKLLLIISSS